MPDIEIESAAVQANGHLKVGRLQSYLGSAYARSPVRTPLIQKFPVKSYCVPFMYQLSIEIFGSAYTLPYYFSFWLKVCLDLIKIIVQNIDSDCSR